MSLFVLEIIIVNEQLKWAMSWWRTFYPASWASTDSTLPASVSAFQVRYLITENCHESFFMFFCKRFLQKNCFAEQSYDKKQETLREKIISFLKENVFILIRKPNGKKWKCKDAAYKMEIILLSVDGKFNTMKKPLNFGGNFTLEKLAKLFHWIVSEKPQYISRAYILLHLWFWTGRSVQQQVGQ